MNGDLPREELLAQGRAMLDWIGEYLEHSAVSRVVAGPPGRGARIATGVTAGDR